MRKDQIFVLMLVILLPMSGCFDGAVGDSEADDDVDSTVQYIPNQHPIWYGNIQNCYHECYYDGEYRDSLVRVTDFFVVDPDGIVLAAGLDFDNDFEIDWSFTGDWNSSYSSPNIEFNYNLIQLITPENPSSDSKCETGWINLIAEDGLGLKEIQPTKWYFDWDNEKAVCLVGP